ncbi:MAG: SGNH/GDSL hydrolase family protein [Ruminococcaceae bacterium]|nr:SGNH/GDSL hydrolase family protein [Oscillospiraceae bacterium]
MDWKKYFDIENEQPLDRFVDGISNTAVFRKIAFVGDSLSSGEFESKDKDGKPGWHDYYEYSWGQYIARKNGLTAYNFSKGGMRADTYINAFADEQDFWNKDLACQAYVIALGVNDILNAGQEIGSVADIKENWQDNAKTFAGYFAAIVMRYKEIQPRAKFFFVTMPRGIDEKRNALAKKHAELLYALAEYFDNAYVIDLYKYAPVYDEEFRRRYFLYGHMNASGYIFTANMIDAYIDYIVRHNPDDFRRVGFIGTDLE